MTKKKQNKKNEGFTLIELLAVITIMGIMILMAIPAVQRIIENSRRDTFKSTVGTYANAIKNAVAANKISCYQSATDIKGEEVEYLVPGYYAYYFDSSENSGKDLIETGGKSSWKNGDVTGLVIIKKTSNGNTFKYSYYIKVSDGVHGMTEVKPVGDVSRADIKVLDATNTSDFGKSTSVSTFLSGETGTLYGCFLNS